jgi:PST family polysaccharide transporter
MLSSRADIIFAGIFFGPVATGIYRLAARLPDMLVDVTVRSIQQVALPSLSRLQRDRVAFAAHLAQLQRLGALVGLPMLGVLAATAPALVELLGPQWAGTARPLQLLCLYGAANVFGALLGPALQAIGQPGTLAAISWFRGVLGVATLVGVGTMMAGGEAAAQATVLALAGVGMQVAVTGLSLWMTVRRAAGATVTRFLAPTLPAILSALAAALVPAGTDRLGVSRLNPVVELLIVSTGAALAAGVVLWFTDRPLRQLVRDRLRRLPSRPERADVGTA